MTRPRLLLCAGVILSILTPGLVACAPPRVTPTPLQVRECLGDVRIRAGAQGLVPAHRGDNLGEADPWVDPVRGDQATLPLDTSTSPSEDPDRAAYRPALALTQNILTSVAEQPPFAGLAWYRAHDSFADNANHLDVLGGDEEQLVLATSAQELGAYSKGPLVVVSLADGAPRYAVDVAVGSIQLVHTDPGGTVFSVRSARGTRLMRIAPDTRPLWCRTLDADLSYAAELAPANNVTAGVLVATLWQYRPEQTRRAWLHSIDLMSGDLRWARAVPEVTLGRAVEPQVVTAPGLVAVSERSVAARGRDGQVLPRITVPSRVVALDATTGEERWSYDGDSATSPTASSSGPSVPYRSVVVGSTRLGPVVWVTHDGPSARVAELVGLDQDGVARWTHDAHAALLDPVVGLPPLVAPEGLVLAESEGALTLSEVDTTGSTPRTEWVQPLPPGHRPLLGQGSAGPGWALVPLVDGGLSLLTRERVRTISVPTVEGVETLGARSVVRAGSSIALSTGYGVYVLTLAQPDGGLS